MKFTLAAHLEELRRRVIGTIVPFFVLSFVSYPLAPQVLSKVKADLFPNIDLIITGPAEAVMTYLWTSALIAATLTFPLACYHVWAFMAPGLVRDERSLILRIVGPSFALLLLGMSFAYLVLLPIAIKYLIQAARPLAIPLLSTIQSVQIRDHRGVIGGSQPVLLLAIPPEPMTAHLTFFDILSSLFFVPGFSVLYDSHRLSTRLGLVFGLITEARTMGADIIFVEAVVSHLQQIPS